MPRSGITSGNRGWIDARYHARGAIRAWNYTYAKVLDGVETRGYHGSFCMCMHAAAFSRSCKKYRTTTDYPAVFLRAREIAPEEIPPFWEDLPTRETSGNDCRKQDASAELECRSEPIAVIE